jgi:drug/metabolite transporter (DMT)-like permease
MQEIGFVLAFVSAFFFALHALGVKKLTEEITPVVILIVSIASTLVFIFPYILYTGIPEVKETFFLLLFINTFLVGGALLLKFKSIKASEASLVTPITSFIPLFLLVFSPFILGENFTPLDVLGVILIIFGSYIMQVSKSQESILKPIKSLLSDTGVRYMLGFALLISLASTVDKIGISKSSTVVWLFSLYVCVFVLMLTVQSNRSTKLRNEFKKSPKFLILIGVANAIMITSQLAAYNFTLVTFTLSIKRLGVIVVVIGGSLMLSEKDFLRRMAASIPMVLGASIITLL